MKLLVSPAIISSQGRATKQFRRSTKPFWAFGAELRKRHMVIKLSTKAASSEAATNWRQSMRTITFLLAFAFVVAGSSMAGSAENRLPGIGTFSYHGLPV